jgi:hypothetical protein
MTAQTTGAVAYVRTPRGAGDDITRAENRLHTSAAEFRQAGRSVCHRSSAQALIGGAGNRFGRARRGFEKILNGGGKAITQAEMQKALADAYAAGVQDAENKLHGAHDFQNTDGKPAWEAIALFLQRNKNRLAARHHEFVDDMASRTAFGREPTEKQHNYLHSLFYKLGGKIT